MVVRYLGEDVVISWYELPLGVALRALSIDGRRSLSDGTDARHILAAARARAIRIFDDDLDRLERKRSAIATRQS